MPRKLVCCVDSCQSTRKDAILFKTPVNEKRFSKWSECLSAVCDTENLSPGISVVCSKHFEPRYITPKSRLLADAYPSLFKDYGFSSILPFSSNTDMKSTQEHSYARKQHIDHSYSKQNLPIGGRILIEQYEDSVPTAMEFTEIVADSGDSNVLQTESEPVKATIRKRLITKKSQLNFHKRVKNAIRFCKKLSFDKLTRKMNPVAKKFFEMQVNMCTKKKNGRRFSEEDKIIASSILKQSPECYQYLSKIFILPCKQTLNNMN